MQEVTTSNTQLYLSRKFIKELLVGLGEPNKLFELNIHDMARKSNWGGREGLA